MTKREDIPITLDARIEEITAKNHLTGHVAFREWAILFLLGFVAPSFIIAIGWFL